MTESLNEKGDLKDGYYWFQHEAPQDRMSLDEWIIVKIERSDLWVMGTDCNFAVEGWKGTYVPVRPREESDEKVTIR